MTNRTGTARLPPEGSFASEIRRRSSTPSRLIGVGSRLGVWGLVGGSA